jgi:hypothetical protein
MYMSIYVENFGWEWLLLLWGYGRDQRGFRGDDSATHEMENRIYGREGETQSVSSPSLLRKSST